MNRWLVVIGAILIQLALGAIYAWSVFTKKITIADGDYGFTASQAAWVFSAGLATFALVMLYAGKWQARIGPRKVAVVGGVVLGAGYILGGFLGKTFVAQLLCIGIVGGAGIGLAYVVPIAVCVKWFPDKKGMITGLAVAGFGFGATIWVKLGDSWVWDGGLLTKLDGWQGLPGVQAVFLVYGIVFAALVLLGSLVMVNPPAGWKPAGWNPEAAGGAKSAGAADLTAPQMVRTPQYWALLLMFVGSALAGLMVIYCIKLFGIDSLLTNQKELAVKGVTEALAKRDLLINSPGVNLTDEFNLWAGGIASTAMALYAILNGLGRIIWGTVSDKIGRKSALILMCLIQGIMMLSFFYVGQSELGLIVGACIIGFNFGGNFALFPAATADAFGNKNVGSNYPWVFLAYGVAGIAGPQVAGHFKDVAKKAAEQAGVAATQVADAASEPINALASMSADAWKTPFVIAGIACLVAAVLGLMLKSPKRDAA
jgi:MFS family permease